MQWGECSHTSHLTWLGRIGAGTDGGADLASHVSTCVFCKRRFILLLRTSYLEIYFMIVQLDNIMILTFDTFMPIQCQCFQIIRLFTKTCIVFVVLFKICFIAYIYLSIFIYLSESLAWACCSLVLGFAASWIITLSSCPSIQPWERGEVLITFRRLYVCSYL